MTQSPDTPRRRPRLSGEPDPERDEDRREGMRQFAILVGSFVVVLLLLAAVLVSMGTSEQPEPVVTDEGRTVVEEPAGDG